VLPPQAAQQVVLRFSARLSASLIFVALSFAVFSQLRYPATQPPPPFPFPLWGKVGRGEGARAREPLTGSAPGALISCKAVSSSLSRTCLFPDPPDVSRRLRPRKQTCLLAYHRERADSSTNKPFETYLSNQRDAAGVMVCRASESGRRRHRESRGRALPRVLQRVTSHASIRHAFACVMSA